MDHSVYEIEARLVDTHWWFVGRRLLFHKALKRFHISKKANILDVGTSTGATIRYFRHRGYQNVSGIEFHEMALDWCHRIGLESVSHGDIRAIPHPDSEFDLIIATDVIEHVGEDVDALKEVYRCLAPDGYALITVPAFMFLWGEMDELSHHKRRYLMKDLRQKAELAGLNVKEMFYFNFILFPLIAIVRMMARSIKNEISRNENEMMGPYINKVLAWIFKLDVLIARFLYIPFGVSIFMMAQKTK
ncbi:MAG: hypothetical protein CL885_00505 [Dehalococcoidia bacterium]|nr:hypothetical protein [Dehalococcoidia bacterium]